MSGNRVGLVDRVQMNPYGRIVGETNKEKHFELNAERRGDKGYFVKNTEVPVESIEEVISELAGVVEYPPDIVTDFMAMPKISNIQVSTRTAQMEGFALEREATVSMEGDDVTEAGGEYTIQYIPMPITAIDVRASIRDVRYAAGRKASEAQTVMMNTLERLFLTGDQNVALGGNGLGINNASGDNNRLYGFANHPQTNVTTYSAGANNTEFYTNVTGLMDAALSRGYSNFNIYFASNLKNTLSDDYSTEKGDKTLKMRFESHEDINMVRFSKALPDNAVLILSMGMTASACLQSLPLMVVPVPASQNGIVMALKYMTISVPLLYANIERGTNNMTSGAIYATRT